MSEIENCPMCQHQESQHDGKMSYSTPLPDCCKSSIFELSNSNQLSIVKTERPVRINYFLTYVNLSSQLTGNSCAAISFIADKGCVPRSSIPILDSALLI